jgi:hypothetical protein
LGFLLIVTSLFFLFVDDGFLVLEKPFALACGINVVNL